MANGSSDSVFSGASHANEFGAALRDMREAHGKSLADVGRILRIRHAYLAAIEEGRFEDLPGPTYASGFVRAYADYLGLDTAEVMRRYRDISQDSSNRATAAPPAPVVEGRMPTGFILFVAGILALAAYGAWYYLTLHGRDAGEVIAQIPSEISSMVDGGEKTPAEKPSDGAAKDVAAEAEKPDEKAAPAVAESSMKAEAGAPARPETEAVAPGPSEPPPATAETATAAEQPVENAMTTPETAVPAPEQQAVPEPATTATADPAGQAESAVATATAEPEPVTAPARLAPAEPVAGRVKLRATAASWVELRRANGDRVISQILRAGEIYSVPGESGIRLTTGNAGGIDILVDGQLLAPLGPVGAVRRDVALDPESLRARLKTP